VPPGQNAAIGALFKQVGCSSAIYFDAPLALALGDNTSLAGNAVHAPSSPTAVALVRVEAAGGKRVFEDTPVVPFDTWYPLQQKRIRYFRKPAAEEPAP